MHGKLNAHKFQYNPSIKSWYKGYINSEKYLSINLHVLNHQKSHPLAKVDGLVYHIIIDHISFIKCMITFFQWYSLLKTLLSFFFEEWLFFISIETFIINIFDIVINVFGYHSFWRQDFCYLDTNIIVRWILYLWATNLRNEWASHVLYSYLFWKSKLKNILFWYIKVIF